MGCNFPVLRERRIWKNTAEATKFLYRLCVTPHEMEISQKLPTGKVREPIIRLQQIPQVMEVKEGDVKSHFERCYPA